jgi:predicted house-cleaning noncanonical NTP pyrophosphatase (MazG superfamily)
MILTNLAILRTIPIPTDLNALEEFLASATFNTIPLRRDYNSLVISLGIGEITYASAFDHLWSFIRKHEHKNELVKRLEEEILDGANVCANGKLARLMNVVEGYLDGITTENRKELFQNRMAIISKMGVKRRRREAKKAFKEYGIPEGEQGPWLEALE